jgi:FkbM family methyltransferase
MIQELIKFYDSPGGVVVEAGSRDGHDAKVIGDMFKAGRVIILEASPYCYKEIVKTYPDFESHNIAIVGPDQDKLVDFWQVNPNHGDDLLGSSSTLYKPMYEKIATKIKVPAMTMDEVVASLNIDAIEVMKIDVEGATYELLQGFSKIRIAKILHLESEHQEFWSGQHLYEDTKVLLEKMGYEQVFWARVWDNQSDSIWIRND